MNYNEVMKEVERKLATMTEKEKAKWIQNIARVTQKHERIKFLDSLNDKQDYKTVIYDKDELEVWFGKVKDGEIYFECSGYEEHGESYWKREYVYAYYDVFEIGKNFTRAFQVAEDLLFQKKYKDASILYNNLFHMSFYVLDRDIEEWNELGL